MAGGAGRVGSLPRYSHASCFSVCVLDEASFNEEGLPQCVLYTVVAHLFILCLIDAHPHPRTSDDDIKRDGQCDLGAVGGVKDGNLSPSLGSTHSRKDRLPFFSGIPSVEVVKGLLHLYKPRLVQITLLYVLGVHIKNVRNPYLFCLLFPYIALDRVVKEEG